MPNVSLAARPTTPRESLRSSASVRPISRGAERAALTPSTDDPVRLAQAAVREMYGADQASQSLGIEILDVAPGRVRLAMRVRPDMVNGLGICHGGIIFALADSAFAFACNSYGHLTVALDASVHFTKPAKTGELLYVEAVEVFLGNKIGIYDVRTTNEKDELVALFKGTAYRTSTVVS